MPNLSRMETVLPRFSTKGIDDQLLCVRLFAFHFLGIGQYCKFASFKNTHFLGNQ